MESDQIQSPPSDESSSERGLGRSNPWSSFSLPSSLRSESPKPDSVIILGEIVGATNLVAVLREEADGTQVEDGSPASQSSSPASLPKSDGVNAFCNVYWGEEQIHQTKTISKNNNPIWACDTGSLFKISIPKHTLANNCTESATTTQPKDLMIEICDSLSKHKTVRIGIVTISGEEIRNQSICNEKRLQFDLRKGGEDDSGDNEEDAKKLSSTLWNGISIVTAPIKTSVRKLLGTDENVQDGITPPERDDDVGDDDSVYGKTVTTFDTANIDDDYIFGKTGTIALRFRVATSDDIDFLNAVIEYNKGFRYARKKNQQALAGVRKILEGKMLAQIVSENSTSYVETLNCELMGDLIDYRWHGRVVDKDGVNRLRVKPGPDPNSLKETEFLSEKEMEEKCYEQSHRWVEAGSGDIGQIKIEILACEGLPNKDIGQFFGNKTDPFACIVYEDCLVQTDVISDCLSPMWMPWTQRAFVLNRMQAHSTVYIGVFNHNLGPMKHTGCGRVTIDLTKFEANTVYTLKYELFTSPVITQRKSKGFITVRLQLTEKMKKDELMSIVNPPMIHVNVKRRKTLQIARYTCYGKYREDVYNMKVLRSYIDEFMENVELFTFELNWAIRSLILWRGQVQIGRYHLPIHSFLAFISATYVIEHPRLLPGYGFLCAAWCMMILMNRYSRDPSPWHRTKNFSHHLGQFLPVVSNKKAEGENIVKDEGFEAKERLARERKRTMEDNKMLQSKIATVRRELQQILVALTEVELVTSESGGCINPLRRLLPVQLLLRDIMYYVRGLKMILTCNESQISFLVTIMLAGIGILLLVLPIMKIVHWVCRLLIWFFLGPWMKLADLALKRRQSALHMSKRMKKVLNEIQEREQKRWMDARILREEALKLKATRMLRFGRFAVRVPIFNITRFYDYPLPASTAIPANTRSNDFVGEGISQYIPGQKHRGVMIPELLMKPGQMSGSKIKIKMPESKIIMMEEQNLNEELNGNSEHTPLASNIADLVLEPSSSTIDKDASSQQHSILNIKHMEPKESFKFDPKLKRVIEQGFEVLAGNCFCGGDNVMNETAVEHAGKRSSPILEGRDSENCILEINGDERDTIPGETFINLHEEDAHGLCENVEIHIKSSMSDLTESTASLNIS